jgi:hypothetical protein
LRIRLRQSLATEAISLIELNSPCDLFRTEDIERQYEHSFEQIIRTASTGHLAICGISESTEVRLPRASPPYI